MDNLNTNKTDRNQGLPVKNNTVPFRQKVEDKVNLEKAFEDKLFAFWGSTINSGKRTLSQAFASEIAKNDYKVLYVELDYRNPSFAITTGLTNSGKNLYKLALSQDNFKLDNFIADKKETDLLKQKSFQKVIERFPDKLHYLALPSNFSAESFPVLKEGFSKAFIQSLRESEYDAVILNLPSDIENSFCFPVMLEADRVFHVLTDSIVRMNEYRELKKVLLDASLDESKWVNIFNKVGLGVSKAALEELIGESGLASIKFDQKRSLFEKDLQIGSPEINDEMSHLVTLFGFKDLSAEGKRKKRFGIF